MSGSLNNAIQRAASDLTTNGVDMPTGWLDCIRTAIGSQSLEALTPDRPDQLIEAHFTFMNARLDDVTTIVFSQAMADLFSTNARTMKPAFARAGKNQFMSRIVLGRRLASRYFHEGRRRVDVAATIESGTWLLQRSLQLSLSIVERDDRASPQVRRMMHSQIATSSAHIARVMARRDEAREELIRSGLFHSLAAELNGDLTPDHDGYAIELALRLHELTGEDSLSQVSAAIARVRDADSATLQGLLGDVEFARAAADLSNHDIKRAMPRLLVAVDHYDRAIALPRDHQNSADIGYHLAKRGRCYATLYMHGPDAAGHRDTVQLDRALTDWLDARAQPHLHAHEIAQLLLARARLASARSEGAAAGADIAQAARLMADHLDRGTLQVEGQALGVVIEQGLDKADIEAVTAALATAAAMPPETPAPSGSMAKAAMWLRGRLSRPEWEEVAEPVLDRIEVDAVHPALTASARGHVWGHAASLARALYLTDSAERGKVLRAVELSRAHTEAAQSPSAAALDGASRAAFEYARHRGDGDEAPSEDHLGGWVDVLMWGISALRTEQTIRTTVAARFDVAECAVRVAEAALRLLDWTEDTTFVETAADGVAIANELASGPRVEAALADLAEALNRATAGPAARQVVSTPSVALRNIPDEVSAAARHSHAAWRTLADADHRRGEAAQLLRQEAALQFFRLAADSDPSLGGKQREGRRGVTSVNDPHGLSRQLVVLKRVDRNTAQREFEAMALLSAWLRRANTRSGWSVPEPLGVVDIDGEDAVFVMRRLPGHTLAHHAMEYMDGRSPNPQRMFEAAVNALSDFHTAMTGSGATSRPEDAGESFRRAAMQLVSSSDADIATREVGPLLNSGMQLTKKDAHAGNWIWSTASGGLIMIDVEGKTSRPVILELATLIDDLPLFALDANGWDQRVAIAERYVSSLPPQFGIGHQVLRHRLEASALNVAVIGLARLQRRSWGASSRGIRFSQYQHRHYTELMLYLSREATSNNVRRAAAALTEHETWPVARAQEGTDAPLA